MWTIDCLYHESGLKAHTGLKLLHQIVAEYTQHNIAVITALNELVLWVKWKYLLCPSKSWLCCIREQDSWRLIWYALPIQTQRTNRQTQISLSINHTPESDMEIASGAMLELSVQLAYYTGFPFPIHKQYCRHFRRKATINWCDNCLYFSSIPNQYEGYTALCRE